MKKIIISISILVVIMTIIGIVLLVNKKNEPIATVVCSNLSPIESSSVYTYEIYITKKSKYTYKKIERSYWMTELISTTEINKGEIYSKKDFEVIKKDIELYIQKSDETFKLYHIYYKGKELNSIEELENKLF